MQPQGQPCYDWTLDRHRCSEHLVIGSNGLSVRGVASNVSACCNAMGTMALEGYTFVWQFRVDALGPQALTRAIPQRDIDYALYDLSNHFNNHFRCLL